MPYRVTVQIHFCYGHRLLDYDGACAHPHGLRTARVLDAGGLLSYSPDNACSYSRGVRASHIARSQTFRLPL